MAVLSNISQLYDYQKQHTGIRCFAHLDHLVLGGECVDYFDSSRLLRKVSNNIALIFPPWSTKVIGPVGAWTGWRDMDEPSRRSVRNSTPSDRIYVRSDLRNRFQSRL